MNNLEIWNDCFFSPIISMRPYLGLRSRCQLGWEKMKTKAMLALRTRSVKFKMSWRLYNCKRGIGVDCVVPMCGGPDTLSHVQVCPFYSTKWKKEYADTDEQMAEYLLQINRDRLRKYMLPIL